MKRLDQGYLHPKLEVPRLTFPGLKSIPDLPVGGEHEEESFVQLVNSFSKHLKTPTKK
jgi:hypothetical protein